jgi:hypothetical protein
MERGRKYKNLTAIELREMFLNNTLVANLMCIEDYEKLFSYEIELDITHINGDVISFCSEGLSKVDEYSINTQLPPIENHLHKHNIRLFQERKKRQRHRKRVALVKIGRWAATFLIIISLAVLLIQGVAMAMAMGYDILDLIRSALSSPEEMITDDDGNRMVFIDNTRIYNSMIEMIETENLNISYPAELPEGYIFTNFEVNNSEARAYAEVPYIDFTVEFGSEYHITRHEYEENDIRYNVFEHYGMYQAYWYDGENSYSIVADDKAILFEIIKNLIRE